MKGIDTRAMEKWLEAQGPVTIGCVLAVLTALLVGAVCWDRRAELVRWWRTKRPDD